MLGTQSTVSFLEEVVTFVHHVAQPSRLSITVFSLQLVITVKFATQSWLLYREVDGNCIVISILLVSVFILFFTVPTGH